MGIFYSEEHRNCLNFNIEEIASFKLFRLKQDSHYLEREIKKSVLVFIIEGKIIITCNEFLNREVKAGEFVLLPTNSCFYGLILEDTLIISCAFERETNLCNRYSFENLGAYVEGFQYDFTILPFQGLLAEYLALMQYYIEDGLGCAHFHAQKRQELFLIFRAYYSKEELAAFFYPIIGKDVTFKEMIRTNYLHVGTIEELASSVNMSLTTFQRKFKETFGIPAHQWIKARKAERILRDISISDKTFVKIAEENGFSSQAYLSNFCKKQYGNTPTEIRENQLAKIIKADKNQ